jgi:acyl carrier protein
MTSETADYVSSADVIARVRRVLVAHGRLKRSVEHLSDSDDLYEAGLTSHASVNVMLALESEFDIEFPDQLLNRSAFSSVAAISAAVQELAPAPAN